MEDAKQVLSQLDPDSYSYMMLNGRISFIESDYRAAAVFLEMARENFPTRFRQYYDLGVSLRKLRDYDEAIIVVHEGMLLYPEDESLLNCLGYIYLLKDEIENSRRAFESSLKLRESCLGLQGMATVAFIDGDDADVDPYLASASSIPNCYPSDPREDSYFISIRR